MEEVILNLKREVKNLKGSHIGSQSFLNWTLKSSLLKMYLVLFKEKVNVIGKIG